MKICFEKFEKFYPTIIEFPVFCESSSCSGHKFLTSIARVTRNTLAFYIKTSDMQKYDKMYGKLSAN